MNRWKIPVWTPCQISSEVLPDPSRAEAIQPLTRESKRLDQIRVLVRPIREQDQVAVVMGHRNDRGSVKVAV